MRRWLTILFLFVALSEVYGQQAMPNSRFQRLNLRWNGYSGLALARIQFSNTSYPLLVQRLNYPWNNQFRGLPVTGPVQIVPTFPWSPTNALGNITYSTNRAVLPDTLRVLFLGNSLTSGRSMPEVLTRMSRRGKQKIKATVRAVGSYTLENHFADVQSRTNISYTVPDVTNPTNRFTWHVVILQEHSVLPVYSWQKMLSSAQKLDGAIKAAKTNTALFMPQSRPDAIYTPSQFLDRAEGGYNLVARTINCPVVPVGRAWQIAEARHPSIQLRERDGYYPTAHGAYLTACMFYAYLTWQSPLGLSNGGLLTVNEGDAIILQKIAWEVFASRRAGIPY